MSMIKCQGCGHDTNTTACDWLNNKDRQAHKCYVRWIDGIPQKGCGFDEMPIYGDYDRWYKGWCAGVIKRGKVLLSIPQEG